MITTKNLALANTLLKQGSEESKVMETLVKDRVVGEEEAKWMLVILQNPPQKLPLVVGGNTAVLGHAVILELVIPDGTKTFTFTPQAIGYIEKLAPGAIHNYSLWQTNPAAFGDLSKLSNAWIDRSVPPKSFIIEHAEELKPGFRFFFLDKGFSEEMFEQAWTNYINNLDLTLSNVAVASNQYFYDDYYHFAKSNLFVRIVFATILLIGLAVLVMSHFYK